MAITMRDRFVVCAPIDDVWAFLTDPHQVAKCIPGGHLESVESERAFLGRIKVAVGPISTSYRGRVEFTELDQANHTARLTAEGHERGGGLATGSMMSSLLTVDDGTEVVVDVTVDGASKIVQMGLGLTQNLAEELFGRFVQCVRARLESPHAAEHAHHTPVPVQVVPLLAKAFMRRFRAKKPAA
ncbi:MAG: SRPBCC family protein [Chloroflexota bacterium]